MGLVYVKASACWGFVWLGEDLSPNYRLYAPLFHIGYLAGLFWLLFLGSCGVCFHHGSLYVDAMDSISLGEALSLNAWATVVVLSVAALLACCFAWRKWGDLSFFSSLLSGECWMETVLALNNTMIQVWSAGDDVRMVHYSYVTWYKDMVGWGSLPNCFVQGFILALFCPALLVCLGMLAC